MSCILHLDSSYSGDRSVSRLLTRKFITVWKQKSDRDSFIYRDLTQPTVPYINEKWVKVQDILPDNYTKEQQAVMKESEMILEEFLSADRYVFGIPMYGFTVPAIFKAYIEHLIRPGRTYAIENGQLKGLISKEKKMLIFTSRGANYSINSPLATMDYHEPYIRAIFGSFGICDIQFIYANNLVMGDRSQSILAATEALDRLIESW